MPISYTGILAEHEQTRKLASIFDICHMGEFLIFGSGAKEALAKALSHNLETLEIGKCRYGFILNDNAGIIDDCIIYCLAKDRYMLVVNGACEDKDFQVLRQRLPKDIRLENISSCTAKIDLQGPASAQVLSNILDYDIKGLGYFSFIEYIWNGVTLLISRTGYTGELGYELYLSSELGLELWQALLGDRRVKPAGLGARDTLRLEAGLPLYGQDLDDQHSPVEAGYGAMLTSQANFIGKDNLSSVKQKLIGLKIDGRRSARHQDKLCLLNGADAEEIGVITSGSFAPTLGYAIALAWIDPKYADSTDFVIKTAKVDLPAKRVDLPFWTGTARVKLK